QTDAQAGYEKYLLCDRWGLARSEETKLRLAWFALILGSNDAAVGHLQQLVELAPPRRRPRYYYDLGSALRLARRPADAIAALQTSVRLDGDNVPARDRLGELFGDAGRLDDAIAQWSAVVAINPNYAPAHHKLAIAHAMAGRPADSR